MLLASGAAIASTAGLCLMDFISGVLLGASIYQAAKESTRSGK